MPERPGVVWSPRPRSRIIRGVIRRPTDVVAPSTCHELARAIEQGELEVRYQPTVRLSDAMVTGFEALVRWRHPELGLLPAAAFLSLAEDCGLVHALDEWVRDEVFTQLAVWQDDAVVGPGFRVAVNISGLELGRDDLAREVGDSIARTGVDPRGIVLELTETCRIVDLAAATRSARLLHELGVELALDDVGSQYATFELLRSFPLDVLNIDRAVVAGCDAEIGEAFTRAVVDLAGPLASRILAEGVETTWQADLLREAGCHEGRGYQWSPALPVAEAEQLLVSGWVGSGWA
jgi:EAL domain-containing protein (putative c-di-GMP-specific phosphodiesterase class I)